MSIKNVIKAIAMQTVNSAALGGPGVYTLLTPAAGLPVPCSMIRIINRSNTLITISYDGVVDHDIVPSLESLSLDGQINAQPQCYLCMFSKGQRIFISGVAGVGLIHLTGYFQPNI